MLYVYVAVDMRIFETYKGTEKKVPVIMNVRKFNGQTGTITQKHRENNIEQG
jgi:hypothetical protein